MSEVLVPADRWVKWLANFAARHGEPDLDLHEGALRGAAPDGESFLARLPFGRAYPGTADGAAFAAAAVPPEHWGVLLVRKGGFAIARLQGPAVTGTKVGRRHVQGRTKAGGQSQQRFARRRDNQAREAYAAAADHTATLLGDLPDGSPVVVGGDRLAIQAVLADSRLTRLTTCEPWLAVGEPRRAVLDEALASAASIRVRVQEGPPPH